MDRNQSGRGLRALQDLADVRTFSNLAKRLGVRAVLCRFCSPPKMRSAVRSRVPTLAPNTMAANTGAQTQTPSKNSLDDRSDTELIAAINSGDTTAFEVLYFRYRDWVVSQAHRFTGDHDAALDVMQETFLYVLRKFPGFKLTANFKTFLYPAVRNLSIAARRKSARYQSSDAEQATLDSAPAPIATPGSTEELGAVLACLSEEHREVLLLRFVDGLSLAEIAEAMNIPLGTVKSRMHNALETLRGNPKTQRLFD